MRLLPGSSKETTVPAGYYVPNTDIYEVVSGRCASGECHDEGVRPIPPSPDKR